MKTQFIKRLIPTAFAPAFAMFLALAISLPSAYSQGMRRGDDRGSDRQAREDRDRRDGDREARAERDHQAQKDRERQAREKEAERDRQARQQREQERERQAQVERDRQAQKDRERQAAEQQAERDRQARQQREQERERQAERDRQASRQREQEQERERQAQIERDRKAREQRDRQAREQEKERQTQAEHARVARADETRDRPNNQIHKPVQTVPERRNEGHNVSHPGIPRETPPTKEISTPDRNRQAGTGEREKPGVRNPGPDRREDGQDTEGRRFGEKPKEPAPLAVRRPENNRDNPSVTPSKPRSIGSVERLNTSPRGTEHRTKREAYGGSYRWDSRNRESARVYDVRRDWRSHYQRHTYGYRPSFFGGFFYYNSNRWDPYWYGWYSFAYRPHYTYPSVYFYYGYFPYLCRDRIIFVHFPVRRYVYVPIYLDEWYYYPNVYNYAPYNGYYMSRDAKRDLKEALADIREAWEDAEPDQLLRHTRRGERIHIFQKGEYSYSVDYEDYRDMTKDAMETIDTIDFNFYKTKLRYPDEVVAYGRHRYYDSDNEYASIDVTYTLQRRSGKWYVTEVGSWPKETAKFDD